MRVLVHARRDAERNSRAQSTWNAQPPALEACDHSRPPMLFEPSPLNAEGVSASHPWTAAGRSWPIARLSYVSPLCPAGGFSTSLPVSSGHSPTAAANPPRESTKVPSETRLWERVLAVVHAERAGSVTHVLNGLRTDRRLLCSPMLPSAVRTAECAPLLLGDGFPDSTGWREPPVTSLHSAQRTPRL